MSDNDQQEKAAFKAFLEFAKAYKYDTTFDAYEEGFESDTTERAWVAFWNGWRARGDLSSAADIIRGYPKDLR